MSNSILHVLMTRDDYTEEEAKAEITTVREQFYIYIEEGDMESAEDICGEYWGLEPDYLSSLGVM